MEIDDLDAAIKSWMLVRRGRLGRALLVVGLASLTLVHLRVSCSMLIVVRMEESERFGMPVNLVGKKVDARDSKSLSG